ncbi:hypothetical protein C8P68_104268 [Mucilaginibacter yixingensis]|uniref:Fructosamine-3-kinase n=1 Tax=Mucilaginibacter yixingensis TaxID=1295612 RepID=A0A2T5J9T8_9SPHI|nr:hypothetical protein C8P68_104268 [Mucilaginibacter yixingensis]
MSFSTPLKNDIENRLAVKIKDTSAVSGGDINQVYRLDTSSGQFLLKVNSKDAFPGMFAHEAQGLSAIRQTETIAVPDVIYQGYAGKESYLLLEWIETWYPSEQASKNLGRQLAAMHEHTADLFGFHQDNYMGSLPQKNNRHKSWSDFFVKERLKPMVKMAIESGQLNDNDQDDFDQLYEKLPGLHPDEPPALVHGDLWSGNYLINTKEQPYLIDPAVSYSNREFDIAMTALFGGFNATFYKAYNDAYPLQPGWQGRLKIWNLYPLLVHVNLFGGGYANQVRQILAAL